MSLSWSLFFFFPCHDNSPTLKCFAFIFTEKRIYFALQALSTVADTGALRGNIRKENTENFNYFSGLSQTECSQDHLLCFKTCVNY